MKTGNWIGYVQFPKTPKALSSFSSTNRTEHTQKKQRASLLYQRNMTSTSATLALCSSFTTQCRLTHHQHHSPHSLFLFKPKFVSSSTHTSKLTSSAAAVCARPAFLAPPRSAASEVAVPEAELDKPAADTESEAAATQVVEVAQEEPRQEGVYAVVMVGGRQYIVIPGRFITVNRLKGANVNDKITLNKVLLVGTKTSTYIGKPIVTNAVVHAVVEEQGLNPKVIVFKYKKKKNYRRNIGHRQPNTRMRITSITGYQDYPAVTMAS